MHRAIELARRAEGNVSPRPPVGAVVVSPSGEIVGEGWTRRSPGPHAEDAALRAAGERARGATVYVSLEPCCRSSVSVPCAEQLIEAGVGRVVAAIADPHPEVNGRGLRALRRAGVDVRTGTLRAAARTLVEPFARWSRTGLPFVTLKLAATLDGKVAAPDGSSMWISGPEARAEVHEMRRRTDAVVVGSMTVLRDDPLLTCRLDDALVTQPLRVVVDGSGRTPPGARVFNDDAPTLVITSEDLADEYVGGWRAAGAEVERVSAGESGVDVGAVVDVLGRRGLCHVLLEGGPTIAASFVEHRLVDRFILYLAPKLVGGDAPGLFASGVKTLADAWGLRVEDISRVGTDIRIDASLEPR
jgi:diaminohydroxyphosphoribosylaminopyrimidine deaminase/5-amino-6-(5-phosphoribosylamino)uracil reductase